MDFSSKIDQMTCIFEFKIFTARNPAAVEWKQNTNAASDAGYDASGRGALVEKI